ncbi:MAG TPA: hypothetical protein VG865_13530, partial [Casimicrobiaceae bacterium]|nr:hypothetical protein [Casimicrobiaceae bacterium]
MGHAEVPARNGARRRSRAAATRARARIRPRGSRLMDARVKPIARVNDFVVKFANVNGSGSASANGLFARSI